MTVSPVCAGSWPLPAAAPPAPRLPGTPSKAGKGVSPLVSTLITEKNLPIPYFPAPPRPHLVRVPIPQPGTDKGTESWDGFTQWFSALGWHIVTRASVRNVSSRATGPEPECDPGQRAGACASPSMAWEAGRTGGGGAPRPASLQPPSGSPAVRAFPDSCISGTRKLNGKGKWAGLFTSFAK